METRASIFYGTPKTADCVHKRLATKRSEKSNENENEFG